MEESNTNQQPFNGQPDQQGELQSITCPKTWFVESILATMLCCLPFGIAGIINASKVEKLFNQGLYQQAEAASKKAKKWTIVASCVGAVYILVIIISLVLGGLANANQH